MIARSGRFSIIPARAIDDPRLGKAALLVLCALGTYSDRDGWSWPSINTLANRLRVTRRHISNGLRQLEQLGQVKRFGQTHGCHVWFVAHPAKMHRDSNGEIPVPTLYDISGSANWANKADLGIVVHRDWRENANSVEIHVRKVRFKSVGRVGVVTLEYNALTGCYGPVRKAGLS